MLTDFKRLVFFFNIASNLHLNTLLINKDQDK
jgi:hypothetical protein